MQSNSTVNDLFGEPAKAEPGKTCMACKKFKVFADFRIKQYKCRSRPNRPARRDSVCRRCRADQCKRYNVSAPGQKASKKRKCKSYGITVAEYDKMFADQEGACAICGVLDADLPIDRRTGKPYHLAIDHDHATGRARQLLCHFCNVGLGAFRDDPKLLQVAISYLAKHANPS